MKIKLSDIVLGKNYSRTFGTGDVSELAASFKEQGQITPVIVAEDNVLVAGYRRYAAAKELGWTEIEAIRTSRDAAVINLIENLNREDPSLWEEIQGIRDVFGSESTYTDICRALSKSRAWVKPRVEVWTLSKAFLDQVRMGHAGVKDINQLLAERRGPSAMSKNMGVPSHPDVKRMISWLMGEGRDVEARALSFAVGAISEETLKGV